MKKLREHPYYLIMLPLFFVLHAFLENYGAITLAETIIPAIIYAGGTFLVSLVFRFLYRSKTKAGIATLVVAAFFFFYTAIRDLLLQYPFTAFLARYRYLVPAFLLFFLVVFIYLGRSGKHHYGFTIFLNLVFMAIMLPDLVKLIYISASPDDHRLSVPEVRNSNSAACDTCYKPDIFLIVMDEYAGSASLKANYNFDNDLDSFLLARNFSIQSKSRSNYNYTVFSMTSLLNMNYIKGIDKRGIVEARHHSNCLRLIRSNQVMKMLAKKGYELANYSVFSLEDQQTEIDQTFVTAGTELINGRTIIGLITADWNRRRRTISKEKMSDLIDLKPYRKSNKRFQQLLMQSARRQKKPRFVYAHFMMPHLPFYYDRHGNLNDLSRPSVISPDVHNEEFINNYLDYVLYTNARIREMIDAIQQQNPKAVILLLGDHGFRPRNAPRERFFENLNAVYYPDGDYSQLYDSITTVNQFRVFFNKFFDQKLPLLDDSTIFIRNRR